MTVKFKCEVVREDRFIVELDEAYFDEAWIVEFNKCFFNYYRDIAEVVDYIAKTVTSSGGRDHIRGIGIPLFNGEKPFGVDAKKINTHVNIVSTQEIGDQECEVLIWEVRNHDDIETAN
ncbi:hypothetical protein HCB27_16805 [Listeria booriae]|uniref:Uncharacterized protein n=1 Tax=Listeria booriae TaxID=1552123 RepID=A0A7X0Z8Z3_9LIST|nr:hypothetical protein [Listeria booriae]MBC2178182.1 hypothetical protein [Listeria booriae]MBC2178291.1 hypothetical protein [Listeria booriae]